MCGTASSSMEAAAGTGEADLTFAPHRTDFGTPKSGLPSGPGGLSNLYTLEYMYSEPPLSARMTPVASRTARAPSPPAPPRPARVAVTPGASRGLGRVLAGFLAKQGTALVIDARGEAELRAAADELRGYNPAVVAGPGGGRGGPDRRPREPRPRPRGAAAPAPRRGGPRPVPPGVRRERARAPRPRAGGPAPP